jgi:N-acetylglucosamine-6-phosphate deacetylase
MRLGVSTALVDGALIDGDLEIRDGRIAAIVSPADGGRIAVPGLVDLQVNGYAGVDFMHADVDAHRQAATAIVRTGTTAYLPTIVSAELGAMESAIRRAGAWLDRASAVRTAEATGAVAEPLGVHVEGPFLSPVRRGVHPSAALLQPDLMALQSLADAGPVRMVTLAPELPGALDLVTFLVDRRIVVSCGHSDATVAESEAAFDAGATTVTHLFNGMRPLHHRDPGIVGAALARDDITVQAIVDHVHLAPPVERLVLMSTRGRLVVVTDAVPAAGLPDGAYTLGPTAITVVGGVPTGPEGQLSGGMGTLLQSLRRIVELGYPLVDAVAAVAETPGRLIGRPDLGRLYRGGRADVLVLEPDLSLATVLKGGIPAD